MHPNLTLMTSPAFHNLFTTLRASSTQPAQFVSFAKRIHRLLVEEALASLPSRPKSITTPCGQFEGCEIPALTNDSVVAVSIIRAGDSLLESVREVLPSVSVGKILIQRSEEDARPKLFYTKLPPKISTCDVVLLCDPMLATGGSSIMAINELIARGVDPAKIYFINVVCCPEGLKNLELAHPAVRVLSASLDEGMNEKCWIVPGLGDYGDRYFNSV
tara:strand:- start:232 stop:882 length:651 start_codon:yes stop_codon:yes gene_type:complete